MRTAAAAIASALALALALAATAAAQDGAPAQPAPPPSVPRPPGPGARPTRSLSLRDAVFGALEKNQLLRIEKRSVGIAEGGVLVAEGAFDPLLSGRWNRIDRRSPFFSSIPTLFTGLPEGLAVFPSRFDEYDAILSQRFLPGTSYSLEYRWTRERSEGGSSLQPTYRPSLSATLNQPLLRGLGFAANEVDIVIARNNLRTSIEEYRRQVMETIFSVEQAYWALYLAIEDRKLQEKALANAEESRRITNTGIELGRLARNEIYGADAAVAQRREAIIRANGAIGTARDRLLLLIDPSGELASWEVDVEPVDRPTEEPAPPVDVGEAVGVALRMRPEYRQAALAIESGDARERRAWNDLLPRLDAVANMTINGLDDGVKSAAAEWSKGTYYDWTVGATFEFPLLDRTARGAHRQAEEQLEQSKLRREATLHQIIFEVREAVRAIQTSGERIAATEAVRVAAEAQLKAEENKLRAGMSIPFNVNQVQEDLTEAELGHLRALVDYSIARSDLERRRGTILERWRIPGG